MGFTRGQPDWSSSGAKSFTGAGGSDLEQAARRNWVFAPIVLGEVHFYEDFESPALHWFAGSANSGLDPALSGVHVNSGRQSVLLDPGTALNNSSYINRNISIPAPPRIGVGVYMSWSGVGHRLAISPIVDTGLVEYDFYMRYDLDTFNVSVRDADLGWTVIGNAPWDTASADDFAFVQLVMDSSTGRYVRVSVAGQEIDYDGPGIEDDSSGTPNIGMWFGAETQSADQGYIYLDDVIVTRNEP
jgi:hypothetical protein